MRHKDLVQVRKRPHLGGALDKLDALHELALHITSTLPAVIRLPIVIAELILLLDGPVPEPLAPDPRDPLPPAVLPDGPGVPLVHGAREHDGQDENPHVARPHGLPPAPLDAHLPEAVDARPRRVQEHAPAVLALDPRPEPGHEPAEEEALRREEGPRQPRLEEADGRPGRRDGARHEGAHAQRVHDELVERREGEVVQRLVLGD